MIFSQFHQEIGVYETCQAIPDVPGQGPGINSKNIARIVKAVQFNSLGVGCSAICTQNPGIARKGGRGGSAPCQDFFGGFVHNALRALQSDHSSPKSDNFPPKSVPLYPRLHQSFLLLHKFSISFVFWVELIECPRYDWELIRIAPLPLELMKHCPLGRSLYNSSDINYPHQPIWLKDPIKWTMGRLFLFSLPFL